MRKMRRNPPFSKPLSNWPLQHEADLVLIMPSRIRNEQDSGNTRQAEESSTGGQLRPDRALGGAAQKRLQLGKEHLDRVEVGRVDRG
jgi:hypothetical protein